MKSRTILLVALVVLVALGAFSIFLATRPKAPGATQFRSPLIGHAAPGFSATTLSGGHLTLNQYRGHYVVLTFWASWCVPCQQEAPDLVTFAYQQHAANVEVVGVVWEDSLTSARTFQTDYGTGVSYPSVIDPDGVIANGYGVTAPPTTFVISPTGTVLASLLGGATTSQLDVLIAQAKT